jgi:hypothetical protein
VVHALGSYPGTPARALLQQRRGHPDLHVALGGRGCCSDHQRFCEAGVPYVFFWTPDPACYHRRCDTPDRVDYPHLSAITEVATELVAGLADSELALMASRQKRGCGRP